MPRQRCVKTTIVGALAVVSAVAMMTSVARAAGAPPFPTKIDGHPGHGCPPGAVCVYPTDDNFATGPESGGVYYSYGPHNLHGQYGRHLVYNNQYPVDGHDAGLSFCGGYNGTGQLDGEIFDTGGYSPVYLTPINSFTLYDIYDWRQYEAC